MCVDLVLLPDYPAVVRSVVIQRGGWVDISFDAHGYDEGGRYYRGQFATLEEAVAALEKYLGRPLEQWENFTSSGRYPEEPEALTSQATWDQLCSDLETSSELLPAQGSFKLING